MYKRAERHLEPDKFLFACLQDAASANLLATVEESEDALAFISDIVSTATDN